MARPFDIVAADGTIDAQVYTPAHASAPLPAVILFTDIGGLRPSYFEKAQTVADGGYAVLLPNIYYRGQRGQIVPDGKSFRDPDVRPFLERCAGQLTPEALAGDFTALLAATRSEPEFGAGGVAAIGYCLSGAFTLRMAALHPDRIVAAAGFHSARLAVEGDPASPVGIVSSIKARVYFGHADKDEYLPADQIARMDEALARAGVHFTTELYKGAAHGFTASDSHAYDAAAAALHYKRVFTLLEEAFA